MLHGHVPYYAGGHYDAILDAKLSKRPNLLQLKPDLYQHFQSSLRYSTQALPVNTLLDTLLRPNADTEANPKSCLEWRYEPERAVSHIALGNTVHAGGQWAENPVTASWEIGTLSYAEMLSLPGYSYSEHYEATHGTAMPDFVRPSRTEVAQYYTAYPKVVGISDAIHNGVKVDRISRTRNGFSIGSHSIRCKHLVLASGIFSVNIPPPPPLSDLASLDSTTEPLLVIGSGFSAADVIISAPPHRKILHLFKWSPDDRPSPLRGCHRQAYPEYAGVYRQMKLAAISGKRSKVAVSPLMRRKSNPFFTQRDWSSVYEGLPNAEVLDVAVHNGAATVQIKVESGEVIKRTVGGLRYVVGRRGTLDYLDHSLRDEVLDSSFEDVQGTNLVSGRTLRAKAEVDLEVAPDVFVIGSLTGDSLVRHAFGGCVYTAGKIIEGQSVKDGDGPEESRSMELTSSSRSPSPRTPSTLSSSSSPTIRPNGIAHEDLHLDRRKVLQAVAIAGAENELWKESGWGLGFRLA